MVKLKAYLALTKPSIMLLVVLTGAAGVVLEGSLTRRPWAFALVLLGLFGTGGCANALNQYFEREVDARMSRTRRRRPLPMGQLTPRQALVFAVAIGVAGVALLALAFNLLSAGLALATILFYGLFYTLWLKPRTAQNIVIGGAAGAMAPVIAWAAASGGLALTPWLLFLVIFLWTPPHFWALALCLQQDYRAVSYPMMPVVAGEAATLHLMRLYTWALLAVTVGLSLWAAGWVFLVAAAVLGGWFVVRLHRLGGGGARTEQWAVFRASIVYLLVLFAVLIGERLAGVPVLLAGG